VAACRTVGTAVSTNTGPLAGVKVIDMSVMISGPLSAMMLADQGADVIKVESPGIGDMMRFLGSQKGGETGIFALHNRGKRSIGVNLTPTCSSRTSARAPSRNSGSATTT
jgi:crotonobetainyl-CoA:carnitine CoA-transferase CaiB-like acyl-CoA transferase